MTRSNSFFFFLFISFFVPWVALIVVPSSGLHVTEQVPVDFDDPSKGEFPVKIAGLSKQGEEVYLVEGCARCHTQVIRPTYLSEESYRRDFQLVDDEGNISSRVRESRPEDYSNYSYAFLGIQRIGPDLISVGDRRKDAEWHHRHLFDPRNVQAWSIMPSFRHLYSVRKIEGQESIEAIDFGENSPIPFGYEAVPTPRAEALVHYLLGRTVAALPIRTDESAETPN